MWATDITYIPMKRGFVYLVAIIDWATRKVLEHRVSISMNTDFCDNGASCMLTKLRCGNSTPAAERRTGSICGRIAAMIWIPVRQSWCSITRRAARGGHRDRTALAKLDQLPLGTFVIGAVPACPTLDDGGLFSISLDRHVVYRSGKSHGAFHLDLTLRR